MIVCAPWVRNHPHVLATIEKALAARLAGCFDGVEEHSPVPVVEEARQSLEYLTVTVAGLRAAGAYGAALACGDLLPASQPR